MIVTFPVCGVDAPHLDVAAAEAREAAGERDGAGHGEVRLDHVAARPVHLALDGHIVLRQRA